MNGAHIDLLRRLERHLEMAQRLGALQDQRIHALLAALTDILTAHSLQAAIQLADAALVRDTEAVQAWEESGANEP